MKPALRGWTSNSSTTLHTVGVSYLPSAARQSREIVAAAIAVNLRVREISGGLYRAREAMSPKRRRIVVDSPGGPPYDAVAKALAHCTQNASV